MLSEIIYVPLVSLLCGLTSSVEECILGATVRQIKEDFTLLSSAYKTTKAEDFDTCYMNCIVDDRCKSINFYNNGTCELNNLTKTDNSSMYVPRDKSVYADVRDPGL